MKPSADSGVLEDVRAYREAKGMTIYKPPTPKSRLDFCWYCGEPTPPGFLEVELLAHPSRNGGRGVDPGSEHGRSLARLWQERELQEG